MSNSWTADHLRRRRRENAVSDVLDGMTLIGAAAMWEVPIAQLQMLVDGLGLLRRPSRDPPLVWRGTPCC